MMKTFIAAILIAVVLQQHSELIHAASCSSNPCRLVPGLYDAVTGYCCTNIPPTYTDAVCSCPNNATPVINGPCNNATAGIGLAQQVCNRTCLNNGVCNIQNAQEVCWCTLGYAGSYCELQGSPARCANSICQGGTCFEQTIGTTIYAYCNCSPGFTGRSCESCYFTCTAVGVFQDPINCAVGRYFYCAQASGTPFAATCPAGQRFNRITNVCDPAFNCT